MKRERLYFSGTRRARPLRRSLDGIGRALERQPTVVSRFASSQATDKVSATNSTGRTASGDPSARSTCHRPQGQLRPALRLSARRAGTKTPEYDLSRGCRCNCRCAPPRKSGCPRMPLASAAATQTRNELAARALVQDMPKEVWDETRLAPPSADPAEPQPRALTLRAFMVLSALYDLRNANTMRQCSFCGSWFTVRRTGALYCSQSCNVTALRARRLSGPERNSQPWRQLARSKTKAGTTIHQARWSVPGPAGKRQQRTKNFANAKEAKAFAARQTTEVELKGVGDPQKRSFGSYLRSWLATLRDRAELSPVTIDGIRAPRRNADARARHDPARKTDRQ